MTSCHQFNLINVRNVCAVYLVMTVSLEPEAKGRPLFTPGAQRPHHTTRVVLTKYLLTKFILTSDSCL